jgi:putative flavoprotein involved in K+ transport
MPTVETLVVGAGHAGLATSRLLTAAGHEHVVLERGRIGERWRSERWDSLHLLTPNWMLRLPGSGYGGPDPDGFQPADHWVEMLERYAGSFAAPVVDGTSVQRVSTSDGTGSRYVVSTDSGTWHVRNLVVATGPHGRPSIPAGLDQAHLGDAVFIHSRDYRNPAQLPPGGVLVVGASASGVQIADELVRAGRTVTLAVGRHTRMPRAYRGLDLFWWLEATGRLGRTIDQVPDPVLARRDSSFQLTGRYTTSRSSSEVDLGALQRRGVRVTGRVLAATGGVVTFADDLQDRVADAEARMHHVLESIDDYIRRVRLTDEVWPAYRPRTVSVPATPTRLHLASESITSVIAATGYRPDHGWLDVPVVDGDGRIEQRRGRTAAPGLYTVGQRFQHRRDSGLIAGARHDASAVTQDLLARTETDARLDPETAA